MRSGTDVNASSVPDFAADPAKLETAARCEIPVLVIVFNNATLAFQRHFENNLFGSYGECDLSDIDHAMLAVGLGCAGERVTDPADLAAAIERGLAATTPYLIDAVIDDDTMAPIVGLDAPEPELETH